MTIQTARPEVVYPGSDGKPMADNTLQYEWIVTIKGGLDVLFRNDPDVFVAGDLLWYSIQGDNRTRLAPDALVAFGRPKGYRGSYQQWQEDGIAPQVVFEVVSPGNSRAEYDRVYRANTCSPKCAAHSDRLSRLLAGSRRPYLRGTAIPSVHASL